MNTAGTLTVTGISQTGGGNVSVSNTGSRRRGAVTTAANGAIGLTSTGMQTIGAGRDGGRLRRGDARFDRRQPLVNATVSSTSGAINATAAAAIAESGSGFRHARTAHHRFRHRPDAQRAGIRLVTQRHEQHERRHSLDNGPTPLTITASRKPAAATSRSSTPAAFTMATSTIADPAGSVSLHRANIQEHGAGLIDTT